MSKLALVAALALGVAACDSSPTESTTAMPADYALALFGDAGPALEATLGPQGPQPFDGRSGGPARLPAELALTSDQKAQITALREAFRDANASTLGKLKAVMERARAAREAGQPREEVRAIRIEARPLVESLRPAVNALHQAIQGVLTAEQRAWLEAHRPAREGPPKETPHP
ncbi:MAG: hypothetical protein EXR92_05875 [Gemmatimonadetes bacterium]|nr:hypothetical protein [Gemmatimonadota bacterium]